MGKSGTKWIPFTADGSLVEYGGYTQAQLDDPNNRHLAANPVSGYRPVYYKPIYEFEATLTFQGFSYGRSAARADYKDANGARYGMFASEFERLMLAGRIHGLEMCGKWTFAKKGANYGLIEARMPSK